MKLIIVPKSLLTFIILTTLLTSFNINCIQNKIKQNPRISSISISDKKSNGITKSKTEKEFTTSTEFKLSKNSANIAQNIVPKRAFISTNEKASSLSKRIRVSKKYKKNTGGGSYTAIILGDIGEFNAYNKNKSKLFPEFQSLTDPSSYAKKCQEFFDAHKDNLMESFKKVLKHLSKKKDDIFILGDMIYVEQKGLGKKINNLRKFPGFEKFKQVDAIIYDNDYKDPKINIAQTPIPRLPTEAAKLKEAQDILDLIKERQVRLDCGFREVDNILKTQKWIHEKNFL